jgi:hypothetical protein
MRSQFTQRGDALRALLDRPVRKFDAGVGKRRLEVCDDVLRPCVVPDYSLAERAAGLAAPCDGGLALVRDPDDADAVVSPASLLELDDCIIDALLAGRLQLLGVVLVPSASWRRSAWQYGSGDGRTQDAGSIAGTRAAVGQRRVHTCRTR